MGRFSGRGFRLRCGDGGAPRVWYYRALVGVALVRLCLSAVVVALLLGVAPRLEALLVVVIRAIPEAVAGRLYYGAEDVVVIGVLVVVAVDAGLVELRKPLRDLVEQVALPVQVGLGLLPPRVDLDAQGVLLEPGEEGAGVFEVLFW